MAPPGLKQAKRRMTDTFPCRLIFLALLILNLLTAIGTVMSDRLGHSRLTNRKAVTDVRSNTIEKSFARAQTLTKVGRLKLRRMMANARM